jgi:hypothetical protein
MSIENIRRLELVLGRWEAMMENLKGICEACKDLDVDDPRI